MSTVILIQITIFDEETRAVKEQLIESAGGQYGYEVENMFYRLGEVVAKKVDLSYAAEHSNQDDDIC